MYVCRMNEQFVHRLSNGLRLLHVRSTGSPVAHCGLLIGAGTREETGGLEGLAHFIEHCLFKGTRKRKSFHILNRLEVVGGELNAYTTKEETCLHASVMDRHLDRALELIADIAFHSIFPSKEIEKEKDVIVDEIHSYADMPYEQIFDDFEAQIFRDHPLGHPILGNEDSVRSFRQRDLKDFVQSFYHPEKMVLAVSANIPTDQLLLRAERYFGGFRSKKYPGKRKGVKKYRPEESILPKNVNQVHFMMGRPAYSLNHPDRYALVLFNNLLGGPGMNSRLNLNIREKYGYTYTIESGYHTYTDNGIFHIYFATDQRHYKKTLQLLERELNIVCDNGISERQLKQYKEQLIGQIKLAQENRLSVLLSRAKSLLNLGKVIDQSEIFDRITAVGSRQLMDVANDILDKKTRSVMVFEPMIKNESQPAG